MNGDSGGTAALASSGVQCGLDAPVTEARATQTQVPSRPTLASTAIGTESGLACEHKCTQTPLRGRPGYGLIDWQYVAVAGGLLATGLCVVLAYRRGAVAASASSARVRLH
eukprot:TRINITY_DN92622_c0_g1_i1.p1 TRINITY_DN92622_c0_g1~~TRINITY_DN92622_c0_g1_i1.p1  ORF type:complete len:111 (-),score=6.65 TRINITY_DN92622_c0_g1_i1:147-479(-)